MKSFLSLALLIAAFAVSLSGQEKATPTPTPDDRDVVKISTSLIQIDVTVIDRKGKIVTDLRRDEVEVYENGKKQDVSHFNFVSNIREVVERPKENKGRPEPVPPPAAVKPEQVRRTIALVVDDLTLSFESTYQVRRALKKFVDEQMTEGDLVAVIFKERGLDRILFIGTATKIDNMMAVVNLQRFQRCLGTVIFEVMPC